MWRGGRATSARRTGRSSSASRADGRRSKQRGPVGAGEAGEIRCEIRFAPKEGWTLWGRAEKPVRWKRGYWAAKFNPLGTTYVFVNVVVAPPLPATSHECNWVAGGY